MNKTEFFECIKDGVLASLRDNDPTLEAAIQQVTKINNIVYHGLQIRSDNVRVSPVIYLDEFFSRYSEDDLSIDDIVSRVVEVYKHNMNGAQDINVDGITDYNAVKSRIIPAICNNDKSSEYLKTAPHEPFCDDLAVYYRILIDIKNGEGSILVNSQLIDTWKISYDELKSQAWSNLHKINPPTFSSMLDVLKEMMPAFDETDLPADSDCCMHILSNKSRLNGAVYIADNSVLKNIADELDSELILLPSSRHELIVLPYSMASDPDRWSELANMVNEINHNGTVSDEDFLADSVYYYTRESGEVRKVA